MEPSGPELYDQLLGYLAAEGEIEEDPDNGVVVLVEFDHRKLEQPLRLHLTPDAFDRHLRDAAPDAVGAFPDVHPLEAAWRLFTVHLDEAVQTTRLGETELVLVRYGVESVRPDGTRTPFAPEVEAHIARQQHFENLLQHLADRGNLELEFRPEIFVIHDLDGRPFTPPLRVRVPSDEFGRQIECTEEPSRRYQDLVGQLDELLTRVDPSRSTIGFSEGGFLVENRNDSRPRRSE